MSASECVWKVVSLVVGQAAPWLVTFLIAFLTRLVRVSLTKHDKVPESLNSLTEHSHTFLDLSVWIAIT